jgi:signal transduction histidine kinase
LGRRHEGLAEYELVLASSPEDLVDEHGVPLGFYAAGPLLQAGSKQNEIIDWIRVAADGDHLLPPAAIGIARDLAGKVGASHYVSKLSDLIRDRQQAEALQRDLARLIPSAQSHEPIWTAYGEPTWLTSITPPVGVFDGLVLAVRAGDVLERLNVSGRPVRLATAADTAGEGVGDGFPGLRVVIPAAEAPSSGSRQSFLAATLLLALTFTMVAGYFLWRDVQRDRRLSEMRSQFVSSVTHELKTPLTAIRMFTETLKLDEDVDRKTRSEYLDTILHESERLSRLVDNVLDFGKIERDKKTYRFQPVRLEGVVEKAARAAQYPLEQAGFVLETAIEPDLPALAADSDALQQAILNLLSNAMKYSGNSRRIDLRLDRKNGHARIHVVDQGIGIALEDQKRIFQRFYRTPSAENQHIPGTGLGLTIVAHIAKAHGGEVEVKSRPGDGSSFTICLPLGSGV